MIFNIKNPILIKLTMNQPKKHTFSTRDVSAVALCAAVMTICAWISVPAPVPFTLQTLGVFVTVGLLGGRRGTLAVLVYLLLGLAGVPVFAGFTGGIGVFLGERGGYLVGFLAAALLMWGMEHLSGRSLRALCIAMITGLILCYAVGTAWFSVVYARTNPTAGVWTALTLCVLPYIIPDAIKIAAALYLCRRVDLHKTRRS